MAHHLEIITQIKKLKIYLEMIIAIIIITIHLVYFQTVIIMKKAKIRIIQLLYLEIIHLLYLVIQTIKIIQLVYLEIIIVLIQILYLEIVIKIIN